MINPITAFQRLRFGVGFGLVLSGAIAATPTEDRVSNDYVMREWHASDGMPGEQVARVCQDVEGFLWIATTDGVVRFDGSHFQKYSVGIDPASKVRVMVWSPRIGLVVGFSTGGAARLEHGTFRPWRAAEYQGRKVVTMFVEPANGVLWIACDEGTVFRDDGETVRTFGPKQGLPHAGPWTFATDGEGRVWISVDNFIARYTDGAWVAQPANFDGSELRLASSVHGGPWVISQDRVWRLEGGRYVAVTSLPTRLGAHYVQVALEDRLGALWIGTRSQGLHVVTGGTLERVPTSYDDIYAVFEDSEGNVWAGTNGGGLDRLRHKAYRLYDKSTGLLDNFSYTVCSDARGDVWVANRDGGLVRLRGEKVERFAGRPGWPTFNAMSVFPRPGGGIGVTTGIGVYFVTDDDPPSIRRIETMRNTLIRASLAARNGDLWFSLDPERVGYLRGKTLEVFDRERGMEGREIRAIAEDEQGKIWIGGSDGNLFRLNGSRFERVPLPGVDTGAIQTIHIESDGRVWIATVNAGVVVLDGGKISVCDMRHGLPDNDITQILPDDHGFYWFGSKHSIFRVSRQEMNDVLAGRIARVVPRVIGPDDGIKDVACSGLYQPGAWKAPDGTLWFATRRGMLALDPSRQFAAQTPPKVAIEEATRDGQPVTLAQPLKIDGRFQKLELRFGVLCLSNPESVHAAYRLDGFDEDWIDATGSHRAAYPLLRPGNYRFRVKANLGEGGGSDVSASLAVVIVPSWWQTDEFRIVSILIIALGVIVTVRAWTNRRLQQQAERLERDSAIRTRIAQNIHDDLGANLTQISLLTQAARQNPSASAKNFEQIHGAVSSITRSMDEIVWAVNPKFDDVESLAGYLGDFARDFLSVAGIRCRLELPDKLPMLLLASQVRHHVFLCCKEALHNVVKHANATEVTIAMSVEGQCLTVSIADNGRGLEAAAASETRAAGRVAVGNGLENMRKRMQEIGGTFTIHPGKSGGTTLIFSVECRQVSS